MTTTPPAPAAPAPTEAAAPASDPMAMLRSRQYIQLLVLAAVMGVPVSAIAYGYLKLVGVLQNWIFNALAKQLGFSGTPV
ncbi:MAG TPA: hypothetical protein VHW93_07620, partial [Acidimicrobiales bacterium]|nr:hypothetical protein [Acidimicrobiales bacterium]